jgi:CHAD domain-containing protein
VVILQRVWDPSLFANSSPVWLVARQPGTSHHRIEDTIMPRARIPQDDWRVLLVQRLQSLSSVLTQLKAEDSGVHDLHEARVACRRAESALRVCRDLLPARSTDRLIRCIRKCRRSTNTTRDQDVLCHWLDAQPGTAATKVCQTLKKHRHQQLSRALAASGNLGKYEEHFSPVSGQLQNPLPPDWQLSLARGLLREVLRFLDSIPRTLTDIGCLHQFRIASKRLKYASEFAAEAIPEICLDTWLKRLRQMQAQLGRIHDTATRIEQLQEISPPAHATWLRNSRLELERLTGEWTSWWRSAPWENAAGSVVTQIVKLIRTF